MRDEQEYANEQGLKGVILMRLRLIQIERMKGHLLEEQMGPPLRLLVEELVPNYEFKGVHDLFNSELFFCFVQAIIEDIPQLSTYKESLQEADLKIIKAAHQNTHTNLTYDQIKIHNFNIVVQVLRQSTTTLNNQTPPEIQVATMVVNCDLNILQSLIEQCFQLMIHNQKILVFMTKMEESDQNSVKQFITARRLQISQHQENESQSQKQSQRFLNEKDNDLYQQIEELQSHLGSRDAEIIQLRQQKALLEEENKQVQIELKACLVESQVLKKRLTAYEETDALFQEKDEEIYKLNQQLLDLEVKFRVIQSELTSSKAKAEQRIALLDEKYIDLQNHCEKITAHSETISKQKEEFESSNKKVINNLKEKNKLLSEKIGQLQRQLVEANFEKEIKDKQYLELKHNYENLKAQSIDDQFQKNKAELAFEKNLILSSSGGQPLRLEDQINQIEKAQIPFEEEIQMYQKAGEENLKKFQEILAQNARLKEKVTLLDGGSNEKLLKDENAKLKKKMAIIKKRGEEKQMQMKEEIEVMVGVWENYMKLNKVQLK